MTRTRLFSNISISGSVFGAAIFAMGALAGSLAGCSKSAPIDDGANPNQACQPIAGAGCYLPYPSSFYEKVDSTSATGFRVNIPTGALPPNQVGMPFNPERYNRLDGFSPGSQIIANLGVKVDDSKLVGEWGDQSTTVNADSLTQLLEYDTGARVPHFAEVDKNVLTVPTQDAQAQVLLIHPLVRLKPNTRYVVALRGLVDTTGAPIVVKPFQSLVNKQVASGGRLEAMQASYEQIFTLLEGQGVPRTALTLAWDFTTASDQTSWGNLVYMRDGAFKRWAAQSLTYKITTVTPSPMDANVSLTIEGTYDVPTYLVDPTDPFSELQFDANGRPVDGGQNYVSNLLIRIPNCAAQATAPLPVVIYGHGNFGSRYEAESDAEEDLANSMCAILVATDWVGQAEGDDVSFGARIASFDTLSFMFDRMQQGQLNFLVLARLITQQFSQMKELGTVPGTTTPLVDGKHVYYYGNSQGGIYGHTFLALSPDVESGVLGVGGGVYTIMIWRSRDFETEKIVSDQVYPNLENQQILWAMAQNLWDVVDPISYAPHSILDPLNDDTGKPMLPKKVLLMEGRYDEQVPNIAARIIARTTGLPLLTPSIEDVYGITKKSGPLDSAYTQWDFHATPPPPPDNTPVDKGDAMGNEPLGSTGRTIHESVRRQPEAIQMMTRFLMDGGQVQDTCGGGTGPCDFPKMTP